QVRGGRDVGPSADLFGLGCVLFECLTGRAAFFDRAPDAVLAKILLEAPPRVRSLRREVPRGLEQVVDALLAKDDARRPDAATVVGWLEELERRSARWSRASRSVIPLITLGALAAAALAGVAMRASTTRTADSAAVSAATGAIAVAADAPPT